MLKAIPTAVLVVLLSGCANRGLPITQADIDERSRAKAAQEAIDRGVIPPFLALARNRGQAARANFCLGVMPPRAIFGLS